VVRVPFLNASEGDENETCPGVASEAGSFSDSLCLGIYPQASAHILSHLLDELAIALAVETRPVRESEIVLRLLSARAGVEDVPTIRSDAESDEEIAVTAERQDEVSSPW